MAGLEPTASRPPDEHSTKLSYIPRKRVVARGIEPLLLG